VRGFLLIEDVVIIQGLNVSIFPKGEIATVALFDAKSCLFTWAEAGKSAGTQRHKKRRHPVQESRGIHQRGRQMEDGLTHFLAPAPAR
jgi:hypothetical protein